MDESCVDVLALEVEVVMRAVLEVLMLEDVVTFFELVVTVALAVVWLLLVVAGLGARGSIYCEANDVTESAETVDSTNPPSMFKPNKMAGKMRLPRTISKYGVSDKRGSRTSVSSL